MTLINNFGWGNMFKTEIHGNLLQTLRLFKIHSGCNSKPTKRRLCYLTLIKMHGSPCSHIWSDVSFLEPQFPRNHHPCILDGLQALLFFHHGANVWGSQSFTLCCQRKFWRGGGVHDYGILRAWGVNAFWNFRRQGGVKTWKPSVVGYGYFLELPNIKSAKRQQVTP